MAKHIAKKSSIVRNAGIAAIATAAIAGSAVPANAFAVATPSANVTYTPSLASYNEAPSADYSWDYTTETTSYEAPAVETETSSAASTADLSGARAQIVSAAYDGIGGSYVWGGKTYKAWDCSGFVSYVYATAGINLTAYTYTMATELVPTSNPQPGDIVFTNGYAHVGIYVGDGQMISALNPSQGTLLTSVDGGGYMPVDGYYTYAGL